MDALRKAEESKKQAEQDKNPAPGTEVESSSVADSSSESAASIESDIQEAKPVNLDIPVEFDDGGNSSSFSEEPAPAAGEGGSNAELELAPKLESQAQTQSYTSDQIEITVPDDNAKTSELELSPDLENDQKYSNPPVSSEQTSASTSNPELFGDEEISGSSTSQLTPDLAALGEKVEVESANPAGKDEAEELFSMPQPKAESIVEKTASSRLSAKTVFAAKRPATKNKSILLITGAGIAAVLLMGLGFYLYTSLSPQSGILVPENGFAVSQVRESDTSVSGSIERDEPSVVSADELAQTEDEPLELPTDQVSSPVPEPDNTLQVSIADIVDSVSDVVSLSAAIQEITIGAESAAELSSQNTEQEPVSIATSVINTLEAVNAESSVNDSVNDTVSRDPAAPQDQNIEAPVQQATLSATSDVVIGEEPPARELVSFRRTEPKQEVAPRLTQAYEAYKRGDLELAGTLYQQALVESPDNKDALLGLAAISVSDGQPTFGMELYSRVLALDPSDAVAKAAIRSLAPLGSAAEQERELRRLNLQHPDVAALVFALGNFYAGQSRWSDAQQQYFKALQLAKSDATRGASISPDYAFNLAVSLEQLNQSRPALTYYEEALALATRFPASFDTSVARSRLESLARMTSNE